MRFTPAASASSRSAEIPGAEGGRAPRLGSMPCSRSASSAYTSGSPCNSPAITSGSARPIQSADTSPLRFSNRRKAIRWTTGSAGPRPHAAPNNASARVTRILAARALQYTLLRGHQILEFLEFAQRGELGVFLHLLLIF